MQSKLKKVGRVSGSLTGAAGESIYKALKEKKPEVIGITSTTPAFSNAIKLAYKIREKTDALIIVGGTHISALPHMLPDCFDIGVIGEGEATFSELMQKLDVHGRLTTRHLHNTPGVCYHHRDTVRKTKTRDHIMPLDCIPHPNRSLFNSRIYYQEQHHWHEAYGIGASMLTSRGCPFRCVFCQSCRFWSQLHSVRYHSAKYVLEEIQEIYLRYKARFINIFDDIFHLNKKHLKQIAEGIQQLGYDVSFGIQGHAGLFDEETAKLLRKMNVDYIGFGFESDSAKILKYLKNGTTTPEMNQRAVTLARKYGFKVGSGFLMGVPGETEADIEASRRFIRENKLDSYGFYYTVPLPGTPLWKYALEKGLVSEDMDWERLNQFEMGNNIRLNGEKKCLGEAI